MARSATPTRCSSWWCTHRPSPGVYLVWRHYGTKGLGSFFRRFTLWRMPVAWWLFLILGIPAGKYLGAALNGTITDFPFDPWYGVLPMFAAALLIGPVEEIGWRGVALPLLQRRYSPLWASLILGAFWGFWHLPAFLLSGTEQSAWSFGPFVLGVLALSVLVTPMFNAARGSLLIAALFHLPDERAGLAGRPTLGELRVRDRRGGRRAA